MKNTMIVAPQSFVGAHAVKMLEAIECLQEYRVFFFKNQEKMCEISDENALSNYRSIIRKLDECGVERRELPVYGFDELFYMMKSESFRAFFDDGGKTVLISPTDSSYYIGFDANCQKYDGELSYISKVANNVIIPTPILFKNVHTNPKSLYQSLDTDTFEIDPSDDEYHFTLDGREFGGRIPDGSAESGASGFTFTDTYNHRIKIWHSEKNTIWKFIIHKINKMIIAPDPKNISFPKALVYNSHNVPVGVVMENFVGTMCKDCNYYSTILKNPVKCVRSVMQNLVSSEMFSLIHSDFYHNLMFSDEEAFIIDVEGCQYGQYPFSSYAEKNDNGMPGIYCNHSHFLGTTMLSYWAAYMSVCAFMPPLDPDVRENSMLEFSDMEGCNYVRDSFAVRLLKFSPLLTSAIKIQYNRMLPLHPMRYYQILNGIINNTEDNNLFTDIESYIEEIGIDLSKNGIPENKKDEPSTRIVNGDIEFVDPRDTDTPDFAGTDKPDPRDTDISDPADTDTPDYVPSDNTVKAPSNQAKRPDADILQGSDELEITEGPKPIIVVEDKTPVISSKPETQKPNPQKKSFKESIVQLWIHIIYLLFNERITVDAYNSVFNNGINVVNGKNEQETKERKAYIVIKQQKLWKKPLRATLIAVAISALMLIIAHMIKLPPPQ